MSESDGRDRPGLTLLVQLFGREVLDSLARAGYGDEAAIAAAGPDRLASTSGVSLPMAQRIVAVVQEARAPSAEPGRAPREQRRRKTAATAAPKRPEPRVEAVPLKTGPDEMDPFVDDVALVSWMGFSSKTSSGRLTFSVADRILDPLRPGPPATEEPPPSAIAPAADIPPAAPARDATPRRTLPGSFWSFGAPSKARRSQDEETGGPADTEAPPGGAPTRRVRDDH